MPLNIEDDELPGTPVRTFDRELLRYVRNSDPEPLLEFARSLERLEKPIDVVEGLHDAVQHVDELRGVFNVLNAYYMSRVITDPALIDGETLFWQHKVPEGFAPIISRRSLATARVPQCS